MVRTVTNIHYCNESKGKTVSIRRVYHNHKLYTRCAYCGAYVNYNMVLINEPVIVK